MSVTDLLPKYSYDEYAIWEGEWELIEGVPVSMTPAPMRIHQSLAIELLVELNNSFEKLNCKKHEITFGVDWKLSNNTVLRPDIVFVCKDDHQMYLTKAPKIIIEILSPSTAKKDETVKFSIYEDEKVDYYLLVYPDDLVAKVYKIKDDKYTKVGDFTNEKLEFNDIGCDLSLNFGKAFKRFRK